MGACMRARAERRRTCVPRPLLLALGRALLPASLARGHQGALRLLAGACREPCLPAARWQRLLSSCGALRCHAAGRLPQSCRFTVPSVRRDPDSPGRCLRSARGRPSGRRQHCALCESCAKRCGRMRAAPPLLLSGLGRCGALVVTRSRVASLRMAAWPGGERPQGAGHASDLER